MEIMNIQNLSFHFKPPHKIISDFNLRCNAGEVVLLAGHSGIGKSTLASLIAGHLIPHTGIVQIEGVAVKGPSRKVIVVHQENDLFPWLTVRGHLEFLKNKDFNLGLPDNYNFNDELEKFGLLKAAAQFPNEISGGMKRRLAILRGLILRPQVLILDESMSSLNKELKLEIMLEIRNYVKERNMVLVLIDHNTNDLKQFIDRTIEL